MSKVKILSVAFGATLALSAFGSAFAATDGHDIGTPGDKNCVGQTTAYLAQLNIPGAHGIGGVSDFTGLSVKEIKALIAAYCA